jgi:CheY-like chemotaxis protein
LGFFFYCLFFNGFGSILSYGEFQMNSEVSWYKTKICTCTAYTTERDRKKSRESGMELFLGKPVNKLELEETLF